MSNAEHTMTREVIVAPPELPVNKAWAILQRRRIRHLPIVRGGELLGIVSDRDILLHATIDQDGSILVPDRPVALAMTTRLTTCPPTASIAELVRTMTELKIDCVLVVDHRGRLVGLVTSTDLLLLLLQGDPLRPLPFDFDVHEDGGADALE